MVWYHMGANYPFGLAMMSGISTSMIALLALAMVWHLVWKGIALWRAGNNKQTAWFVVLFLVNTLGILEIIYLIWFQKKPRQERPEKEQVKKRKR